MSTLKEELENLKNFGNCNDYMVIEDCIRQITEIIEEHNNYIENETD